MPKLPARKLPKERWVQVVEEEAFDELSPASHADLLEDAAEMVVDSVLGDKECPGDTLRREATHDELYDLLFSGAQPVGTHTERQQLVEELNPDLVVLDLLLRGEGGGIELCRNLKSLPNPPYVLVYSAYNSPEEIAACRLCGVDAYVHKSEDPEQLLDALRSARAGEGKWFTGVEHEDPDALLQEAQEQANLTEREQEVFALLRRRRTDPEIAEELCISPHTVKTHVANVLAKLGYTSRRDLS